VRSASTVAEVPTSRSSTCFSRASGANSTSIFFSRSRTLKAMGAGLSAPESMREISSSADMISSTALSEASIECASSPSPLPPARSINVAV
jgi:hypothetical protein